MRKLAAVFVLLFWAVAAHAQQETFGYDNHCANLQQTSCVFKTAPGNLMAYRVTNWGVAVVVYLIDSATVPAAGGANVTVVQSFALGAGTTSPVDRMVQFYPNALLMTKGIVAVCSSTGLVANVPTYTASASCTFEAETR